VFREYLKNTILYSREKNIFHFPIRSHVNSVSHLGFINQNSIKRLSTKKHELHAASITGMCQIYKKHELGAASITGMCLENILKIQYYIVKTSNEILCF
jgi:hypothetical protein